VVAHLPEVLPEQLVGAVDEVNLHRTILTDWAPPCPLRRIRAIGRWDRTVKKSSWCSRHAFVQFSSRTLHVLPIDTQRR
jgi:hypothetical protein